MHTGAVEEVMTERDATAAAARRRVNGAAGVKSSHLKSSHLKSQARPNHVKLSRQLKPSPTLSLSLGLILALSSGESERAHTCACTRMVCMHMHAHLEEREQHACRPRVAKSLEARHLHHHTQSPTTGRT